MEREGCCSKPCTGGFVCVDCCAQEAYVHAGAIQNVEAHQAGKLPKDRVIGRMKQEGVRTAFTLISRADQGLVKTPFRVEFEDGTAPGLVQVSSRCYDRLGHAVAREALNLE